MIRCTKCRGKNLVVTQRLCNYSAFSGYHRTASRYSQLRCLTCGRVWRTKADVGAFRDGSHNEPAAQRGDEEGGDRG